MAVEIEKRGENNRKSVLTSQLWEKLVETQISGPGILRSRSRALPSAHRRGKAKQMRNKTTEKHTHFSKK